MQNFKLKLFFSFVLFTLNIHAQTIFLKPEIDKSVKKYTKINQIAIDDAAYMPIYYDQSTYLTQKYVQNLEFNALDFIDLSSVYLTKQQKPLVVSKTPNSTTNKSLPK